MKNMNKINKFLEIFWLVISIVSIILVVYVYSSIGPDGNWALLLLPVITITMYFFRRRMAKRYDEKVD
jgi:hypothetical protein